MTLKKFSIFKIMETLSDAWSPKEAECIDPFVLRVAKFEGAYHWHKHEQHDELFFVFKGKIKIQTKEKDIILEEGEGLKMPKGVEHCPIAIVPSIVLMFEPKDLESKGD